MVAFRNLSIARKLTLIIMVTSSAALLVASFALGIYDSVSFRRDRAEALWLRARIMASNSTAAMTFDDPKTAEEVLAALKADHHIISACIFTADGRRFAKYLSDGADESALPALPEPQGYFVKPDRIEVFHPIVLEGRPIGTLYIRSDLRQMQERTRAFMTMVVIVTLAACLLAFLLSFRLQRVISGPINSLAATARRVSAEKDYAVRAVKRGTDELGVLVDTFNEMLVQIQSRDAALRQAQDELEDRVRQRTQELQQEVSERTRVQEELQDSESTIRTMAGVAHDAVIMIDPDGLITFWNDAAEKTFGHSRQDALGRELHRLVVPARYLDAYWRGFARFRETGTGPTVGTTTELVARRSDGREFPVEVAVSAVKLKGRWHAVGLTRDITERKRTEAELQRAKEAAEAANRSKSAFLANMSHEIRTPMNGVIGMTELALETELSAEQREYLEMAKTSADALLHVINDVLDFSKIEAGKLELQPIEFNLRERLDLTMRAVALRAHQKGLELAYRVPHDLPTTLIGDPGRLHQILLNLIGNAVKFTAHGEVVLEVHAADQHRQSPSTAADAPRMFRLPTDLPSETTLRFSVRDTGIGIPPEKQATIFEPFEQADSSTTRRYGGSGLGLAIASELVELMHGKIWLESVAGEGSTFHFTARFGVSPQAFSAPKLPPLDSLEGLTILAVDDNATNAGIVSEILTHLGMRPVTADGPHSAFRLVREATAAGVPYPLMLIDADMPGMDGFELVRRLKEESDAHAAIIMMLSSIDLPHDAARCRELGIATHLTKPVQEAELVNSILAALGVERYTDRHPVPRPGATAGTPSRPLRILLAEDDLVNQRLARRILEKHGHSVFVAGNGRQAVGAFQQEHFDLVLMDVQMPEMDGLEAAAAIRALEQQSGTHTPIVAMTAYAMKGDEERCLAAGMDGYIAKPIQTEALFAMVRELGSDRLPNADAAQEKAAEHP